MLPKRCQIDPIFGIKLHLIRDLGAEPVGFEPTEGLRPLHLSRVVH